MTKKLKIKSCLKLNSINGSPRIKTLFIYTVNGPNHIPTLIYTKVLLSWKKIAIRVTLSP